MLMLVALAQALLTALRHAAENAGLDKSRRSGRHWIATKLWAFDASKQSRRSRSIQVYRGCLQKKPSIQSKYSAAHLRSSSA